MKRQASSRPQKKSGFTLVELLVSIAVLSILIVGLAQAMNFVTGIWLKGIGTVDNFTKARVILNLLDRDVQMMVMRPDVAAFVDGNTPPNPACAFFTNVQGSNPTNNNSPPNTRTVSLVQYSLVQLPTAASATSSLLQRQNYGMDYTSVTPAIITSLPTTNLVQLGVTGSPNANVQSENISTGVILFKYQFVDGTGAVQTPDPANLVTNPAFLYNYLSPSAATNYRSVIVSMVVLSNSAYNLAITTNKLAVLTGGTTLPITIPTSNQTYSQVWNSFLDSPNSTFTNLPPAIRQGLLVFKRQIPLPTPAS